MGSVLPLDFHWNTVAIARQRMTSAAVRALAMLGCFRATRYPHVIAGSIEKDPAMRVLTAWQADHSWTDPLVRLLPLERSVVFERADVTETLCVELEQTGGRVFGHRFYVRARLRGLEGRLEGRIVEQAIGAFLLERSEQAGTPASVCFEDPDLVVMIEVIEQRVGYGFLDRAVRGVPLVRPR